MNEIEDIIVSDTNHIHMIFSGDSENLILKTIEEERSKESLLLISGNLDEMFMPEN